MGIFSEKILVVDSDEAIQKTLSKRFNNLGYKIILASDGKEALSLFDKELPDIVILDIILSKLDGYEVCRQIRQMSQTPIIIISSLNTISNRVMGLETGADDYIIKPFSPKELEIRIRSILRRSIKFTPLVSKEEQTLFYVDKLDIKITNRSLFKNNLKIKLTTIEFNLLQLLLANKGKGLARTTILDNIWGYTPERYTDTRVVDVYISRLRSKIEKDSGNPDLILTVRGVGYTFYNY
jgi:OmpR family response regulator RpaB